MRTDIKDLTFSNENTLEMAEDPTPRQSKYWLLKFDVLQVETIKRHLNSLCDKYIIYNDFNKTTAFVEFHKKLRASTIQNKIGVEITCITIDMNCLEDYQDCNEKTCLENNFIYSKGYSSGVLLNPKVKELLDNIKNTLDNTFTNVKPSFINPIKKFIEDNNYLDYKNYMSEKAKNIKNTYSYLIQDLLDYNLITDQEYDFINVLRYNLILVDQTDFEFFDQISNETLCKIMLVHNYPLLEKVYRNCFENPTINVDLSLKKYLYKRIPHVFQKYPEDVNFQNDIESIKWHLDVAPRHPINYLAFVHVSKTGNIDILNYLLETIKIDNTMKYEGSIDNAAKNGHFDIVKKLLEFDFRCSTNAIDHAMENNHYDIAKYLLENGKKCTIKAIDPTKLLKLMFDNDRCRLC